MRDVLDEGFQDCLDRILKVDTRKLNDKSRMREIAKWSSFYELAKTSSGDIVELGAGRGLGTMALAEGAEAGYGAKVHTIDLYGDNNARDKHYWDNNTAGLDVYLYVGSFRDVARDWSTMLSLIVWDGCTRDLGRDLEEWRKNLVRGGVISFVDTDGFAYGGNQYINYLIGLRYTDMTKMPGGVWAMKRGVYD